MKKKTEIIFTNFDTGKKKKKQNKNIKINYAKKIN